MATRIGAVDFLECSAKENVGVYDVFYAATRAAMSKKKGMSRKDSYLKAKLKEEAAAVKAKLKEEADAEKAKKKSIAAADKQEKVAWKQRYAAASPEEKVRMKEEAAEKKWTKTATPSEIQAHQKQKAEAEAQRLLLEKADAAAAAARDAILSGADSAGPAATTPAPYEDTVILPPPAGQKRSCSYVSAKGSCSRKFSEAPGIKFCKLHRCNRPGCNAKKSSSDDFCSKHIYGEEEEEEDDDANDYDLTGDSEIKAFAGNPEGIAKYVAPEIRLGPPVIAAHGLAELMGVSTKLQGRMMQMQEKAIINEFEKYGKPEDKDNLKHVLAGTYREDWGRSDALSASLDALLATAEATAAHLEQHHILALRLYTTSSYKCINEPLRRDPPPKQHPFAATTLFIQDGIKKLRAISTASGTQVFWRGMKDRSLPKSFGKEGGAEFACMSTSADFDIAVKFAEVEKSACPLIFKYVTTSFMNRGADISFLSVYPEEKEVLYPPLTYLKPMKVKKQSIKGKWFIVAEVEPMMS